MRGLRLAVVDNAPHRSCPPPYRAVLALQNDLHEVQDGGVLNDQRAIRESAFPVHDRDKTSPLHERDRSERETNTDDGRNSAPRADCGR